MVSNSLTFALGPRLLNGQEEDSPEQGPEKDLDDDEQEEAERGSIEDHQQENEETSLLPSRAVRPAVEAVYRTNKRLKGYYSQLSPRTQNVLDFLYQFWNPPLIGAVIGAIVGLVPALHRLFFSKPQEGGYFNAWLTSSIKNIGDLFASLQVVVVGVKLSQAMLRHKKGEQSGSVPWKPFTIITIVRFIIWPLISIPLIYALASKTSVLSDDPILWFAMMLMPTGPPAMKLTALADVSGAGDEEKMSIAKFLTVSTSLLFMSSLADFCSDILCHLAFHLLFRCRSTQSFSGNSRQLNLGLSLEQLVYLPTCDISFIDPRESDSLLPICSHGYSCSITSQIYLSYQPARVYHSSLADLLLTFR